VEVINAPEPPVNWAGLLGYLNFSTGKPDARFQGQFHAACRIDDIAAAADLPLALADRLDAELTRLASDGTAAFQDVGQARAVIQTALRQVPPAYRAHHRDLLAACPDRDLFTSFFLSRACEAVLMARTSESAGDPVAASLERLNDYVGYRPIPTLESRQAGELYDHERFRPVPVYIRSVGVAAGRFQDMIRQAFTILLSADRDLLEDAQFDFALLDEFAVDPRPYDHNHPANRRPNHVFGEWDPHHLDALGRHRRFVARQSTLDAILARVEEASPADRGERLFEASAALAGTMLMSSALCGRSPLAHDSTVTLSTLVPQIARLRDTFYERLIEAIPGPRGERLRAEAKHLRQPFGGVRQNLNQRIAVVRATQLQERHLAVLLATLGYRTASRDRASRIATPSARIVAEIRSAITAAEFGASRGEIEAAQRELESATEWLHRGIDCGVLADPWSLLGFQGLYPLFHSREDSLHDPRVEELLEIVGDLFGAFAHVMGEAAARGRTEIREPLAAACTRLADWWDQFASYEVSDLPRVHGGELSTSATRVAEALALWRECESAGQPPDLAFWRRHIDGFKTPGAFSRVVAALLDRGDLRASMGLLMAWLSESSQIALQDGEHSFHQLAQRWMSEARRMEDPIERAALMEKFIQLLEANADELWIPPADVAHTPGGRQGREESEFSSAYEGVTFRDTADDGTEGALLGDSPAGEPFDLEGRERDWPNRFQFLATVGRLWRMATPHIAPKSPILREWHRVAQERVEQFDGLLDQLHSASVPAPPPGLESAIDYDRRRGLKEHLIDEAMTAALAMRQALRTLRGRVESRRTSKEPWEDLAVDLDRALDREDAEAVRGILPTFISLFRVEPLLYVPLSSGGEPAQILRARSAQALILELLEKLPRLGLLRETHFLMQTARSMEENGRGGRRVTEFDRLFPVALRESIGAVLDLAGRDPQFQQSERNPVLERLAERYQRLWTDHSESIRLSVLESLDSAVKWERLRGFVQRFGRDLFTTSFLQLANWRAILHRGVDAWLDDFVQSDEAPQDFLDALESDLPREQAVDLLTMILHALVENYDEYRDYNATTTQSDYGENIHVLFDFLRVKCGYERYNWQLKPLVVVHDVFCRRGLTAEAVDWQHGLLERTQDRADRHLDELAEVEQRHGMRLRSIRDRLEERFVAPLEVDRLASLLSPAWSAAQRGADESAPVFARLMQAIDRFAERPTGVGLDLPVWLERLETDLLDIRRKKGLAPTTESRLTAEDLRDQLALDWSSPPELE
jgi:hypothetical protein